MLIINNWIHSIKFSIFTISLNLINVRDRILINIRVFPNYFHFNIYWIIVSMIYKISKLKWYTRVQKSSDDIIELSWRLSCQPERRVYDLPEVELHDPEVPIDSWKYPPPPYPGFSVMQSTVCTIYISSFRKINK